MLLDIMTEETLKFAVKDKKRPKISVSLIAERNIPNKTNLSADEMAVALLELSHVRLDREQISLIDDLDCLGPVTNLYLQKNEIDRIQNLEVLPKLRFLTLAENKISKVENLKMLTNLQFLDLSHNQIEKVDADEFPSGLLILLLKGNPCTHADYKMKLLQGLPALQQLDGEMITREDRLQAGCAVEDELESDEESDDEEAGDIPTEADSRDDKINKGTLSQHCNNIIVRAKIRTMKEEKEHEKRMEELAHIRDIHAQWKSSQPSSKH